ncbi:carbamoyltransferase HypF [Mucilaginibacter gotjawali]|uniref:Hydrogenase maturation protein HypF n=2 Tax=Mucilaginibacter gotjawali TaxID=1550579 RepID=A0A839SHZ4_9SPHI|nr:carbamoyltransferase HypF [Mucilaginibacter gotjawali]MBB3056147.1 hydrogenase maturation protein HypF [Mucilaginibacter gotjawali]BAU53513.1 Carbamoyltransferase HypF [Mucilaginibacter gotjawali]
METYHIHINGIVQGVGFRPMIYHLAKKLNLNGYVKNDSDGVNVIFNASYDEADAFFKKIKLAAPEKSKIISAKLFSVPDQNYIDFTILVEDNNACEKQVLLSPDMALCPECRAELYDTGNRRYRYPFITCTQCGPRYSILKGLPYERHTTSMQSFTMCNNCSNEYHDISDRRFFSQTNSCADCGISLSIYRDISTIISSDTEVVLSHIKKGLQQGKILAVKGIGGYLLLCDANNSKAICILRTRKYRPSKPFAILYPGIKSVQNSFELDEQEKALLESPAAPIVLLVPKRGAFYEMAVKDIAPGLKRLGVMIPYNPLLELISADFGGPLIATSANISGSPIIYKDDDALNYLFDIADYVVSNNREIIIPQDDSVVQVSKYTHQQIIFRRSRGYAPSFLDYQPKTKQCIMSTGAFLKSCFALAVNGNVFVSQFLGSGESFESQLMYRQTLEHWLGLYGVKPEVIVADRHPGYFSTEYAIELAEKFDAEVKLVQHHEAHFAAVLAENKLIKKEEPILGVIWDGTGLGTDRNIWGGEFFKYEHNQMERVNHFDYFPTVAGDKTAMEPRIAALCAISESGHQPSILKEKFTNAEWNNYHALIRHANLYTSSAGRIFDAVASLVGICDKQSYEGEAAMYLQRAAAVYVIENGFHMDETYIKEWKAAGPVPTTTMIRNILADIASGKSASYVAAKFHYTLVCLIGVLADRANTKHICFSGGVFQNALLVDWIKTEYENKYQLYFHINLSPNDENISFGQMVYHDNGIKSKPIDGTVSKRKINKEDINDLYDLAL